MTLWVADISANNPNYESIIKNNDATIVKVSEGLTYINPLANAQINTVLKYGKRLGLYHFIVGGIDIKAQADYFYNHASNYINQKGTIVVLDWERPSNYPGLTGNEPKIFLDRLKELTGKNGLLYMGTSDFISAAYDWSDIKNDYGLWIAGYPLNNGAAYSQSLQDWANQSQMYFGNAKYNGYTVAMWQYDSSPYDRSIFYGSGSDWDRYGTKVSEQNSSTNNESKKDSVQKKAGIKDMLLFKSDVDTKFGTKNNVFFLNGGVVIHVDSNDTFTQLKASGVPYAVFTKRNTESIIDANGGVK